MKKVFILQNGEYIELSYQKFQEMEVKNKKFLPLYGTLMEVSIDAYKEYYRNKRRQKYLQECAVKNGEVSYHAFTTDEKNGEDMLTDSAESVDLQAEKEIMTEELRKALFLLPKSDYDLIYVLYFERKTEREFAAECGLSQVAVHKRKEAFSIEMNYTPEYIQMQNKSLLYGRWMKTARCTSVRSSRSVRRIRRF